MTKDYLLYLTKFFKYMLLKAASNIFVTILAITLLILNWPNYFWLTTLLVFVVVTNDFVDLIAFLKRVNRLLVNKRSHIAQLSYVNSTDFGQVYLHDLQPSVVERAQDFERADIKINEYDFPENAFYSKSLNNYLRENKIGLIIENEKRLNVRRFISRYKDIVLQFLQNRYTFSLRNNKLFTNGKKISMARDIDLNNNITYISKGEFFSGYITNDICTTQLKNSDTGETMADPTVLFPMDKTDDGLLRLQSLNDSKLHNQIGACTLGVTKDKFLIIWKQNIRAQYSNNLLVSTGSGSADWEDVVKNDFSGTIINTMERELAEESKILDKSKSRFDTKILGFFRWVRRGGLPEFVGLTKLDIELNALSPELEEVKMPKVINTFHIDSVEGIIKIVDDIITQNEGEISVPLYMNLLFLKQYAVDEPDELKRFLFEEV